MADIQASLVLKCSVKMVMSSKDCKLAEVVLQDVQDAQANVACTFTIVL